MCNFDYCVQFYAMEFRKRLDNADTYSGLCSLLCSMVERFNVRIILDGLDDLEDRFLFQPILFQILNLTQAHADSAPGLCCILSVRSAHKAPRPLQARALVQLATSLCMTCKLTSTSSGSRPDCWSRFIVSCSSDEFLEDERNRGASSRLKNIGAYVVKLPELSFENAAADAVDASQLSAVNFVQHVLQQQRRRLQPFQLESLRTQVMNFDFVGENSQYNLQTSSPAYVKMLALQARRIHNLESRPLLRLNRCSLALHAAQIS